MNPLKLKYSLVFCLLFILTIKNSVSQTTLNLDSLFSHGNYYFNNGSSIKRVPYRLYIPGSINSKIPIVLYLHGSGNRGNDSIFQIPRGVDLFFERVIQMEDTIKSAFLVPQLDVGLSWPDENFEYLALHIIDSLVQQGIVDTNKIFCIGTSRGSAGLIDAFHQYPNYFAAGIPHAGATAYQSNGYFDAPNLWLFQGIYDSTYLLDCEMMAYNSFHSGNGEMALSLMNSGHGVGTKIFEDSNNLNAIIYWLYSQSKAKPHTSIQWLQKSTNLSPIKTSTFLKGRNSQISPTLSGIFQIDSTIKISQINSGSLVNAQQNNKFIRFCFDEITGDTAYVTSLFFQAKSQFNGLHVSLKFNQILHDFKIDSTSSDSYLYTQDELIQIYPNTTNNCFELILYADDSTLNHELTLAHFGLSAIQNENNPTTNLSNYPEKNSKIKTYPNPSDGHFTIDNINLPFKISIYTLDGKAILSKKINNSNINLNLDAGIYLYTIETSDEVLNDILIIKK